MNRPPSALVRTGALAAGVIAAAGGVGLLIGPVDDLANPHPTPQAQAMANVCGEQGADSYRCFAATQAASAASSGVAWSSAENTQVHRWSPGWWVVVVGAGGAVAYVRRNPRRYLGATTTARPARRYVVAGVAPLPVQHVEAAATAAPVGDLLHEPGNGLDDITTAVEVAA